MSNKQTKKAGLHKQISSIFKGLVISQINGIKKSSVDSKSDGTDHAVAIQLATESQENEVSISYQVTQDPPEIEIVEKPKTESLKEPGIEISSNKNNFHKQLINLLEEVELPMFREHYAEFAHKAVTEDMDYEQYLFELAQREREVRRANKIAKLVKASNLPKEKTMANFDLKRLPLKIRQQVKILLEGSFIDRTENILALGRPGSGKTHLLCAICHHLVQQGRKVYFTTCDSIVQELLRAKRDLKLDNLLKKLSQFEVIMIDDFGYVKQDRDEMEVLFSLLAYRYERGSVLITSNLPFSKWETIFKVPMTTVAVIDRLVHHSIVLELNVPSYRAKGAVKKK